MRTDLIRTPRSKIVAACAGLALVLGVATRPVEAQTAEFTIDPDHFSIGFLVDHIGYAKVLGMFREASGSFTFDEKALALSNVKIAIKSASVFSNQKERDEHLRSPDFLNAREFPEMTFVGKTAERTGERTGRIAGELTLLGKTQPITLDLRLNKAAVYPIATGGLFSRPNYVVGVSARGAFKRSAFGMSYGLDQGWVGDEVEFFIEFEAIRK